MPTKLSVRTKRLFGLFLFLAIVAAIGYWKVTESRDRETFKKREAMYAAKLQDYVREFKKGMDRAAAQQLLRARGVAFTSISVGYSRVDYEADLITIGKEIPPWYCSEAYVFVALVFSPNGGGLDRVELYRPLTGCL
jgi:hypothetical protein